MSEANYLVYVAINVGDNPEKGFRYVGKTNDFKNRKSSHKKDAHNESPYDFHVAIRKWGWESFDWRIDRESMLEWEALDHEIELIAHLNTFHGDGYNMTEGGDGVSLSADDLAKRNAAIKKAHSTPENRKGASERTKNQWKDKDIRKRRCDGIKKAVSDPEYRRRMSEISKKCLSDPKAKKKMSDAQKKRWSNPENRKKQSETLSKSLATPAMRRKIKEGVKRAMTPEFRKRRGNSLRKTLADPEMKKRLSDAQKKKWKNHLKNKGLILIVEFKQYNTYKEAADAIGKCRATINKRIKQGRPGYELRKIEVDKSPSAC